MINKNILEHYDWITSNEKISQSQLEVPFEVHYNHLYIFKQNMIIYTFSFIKGDNILLNKIALTLSIISQGFRFKILFQISIAVA